MQIRSKKTAIIAFLLDVLILCALRADASWLIDPRKFHVSAHGQTPCLDCHGDVAEEDFHPAPGHVNKKRADFFERESCLFCHDEVMDDLGVGLHGTRKIKNPKKYEYCIRCHRPHRQARLGQNRMGSFDPTRPRHEQCGACHEKKTAPPPLSYEDGACMVCHSSVAPDDPQGKERIHKLCFHCHGKTGTRAQELTAGSVALIDMEQYKDLPHGETACIACHPATLSAGDTATIVTLIIFFAGIVLISSYWLSGSMPGLIDRGPISKLLRLPGSSARHIFSRKILLIIKALLLDVLLQRRLYRQSQVRWFIHGLIFWPFLFRFSWGMVALIGSLSSSEDPFVWVMLNKNHPATAFLFDLSGVMIILGLSLAFILGTFRHHDQLPGLPRQDRLALGLIGSIAVAGFVLEGMGIAITGRPDGSGYSVVGYIISLVFSGSPFWNTAYGYLWYVHAILTGAFVAYLPFSRLFHIIIAPLSLVINAVSGHENNRRH